MGHLASQNATDPANLRRAIAYGTVTASIGIEGFSLTKFFESSRAEIDKRLALFEEMVRF
jgi:hypothetical protein